MGEDALRVLDKAIIYGFSLDGKKYPGAIISSMSKEDREKLRELTSEDTMNQRVELK